MNGLRPRALWAQFVMLLVVFAGGGCASGEGLGPIELSAQQLVSSNAESAFEVWLDREQHATPLQKFWQATADATSKAELEQQWAMIAGAVGQPNDFLQRQVFSKAAADGDWPTGVAFDERAVFVTGVRSSLRTFLDAEGN